FIGHPMIGAAVEIVLPCPLIFKWHELIHIDSVAIDQLFFCNLNPFLLSIFHCFISYWQLSQASPSLHALGVSSCLSTTMLLDADLFFIQRGCRPRLLMSIDDFSICVALSARR